MLNEEAEGLDRRIKLLQKYCLALYLLQPPGIGARPIGSEGRQNLEKLKEEVEGLERRIKLLQKYCLAQHLSAASRNRREANPE